MVLSIVTIRTVTVTIGYFPKVSTYADWESFGAPGSTNTQWQDLMFRDALYQEYRINVSGGNKNTRYSVSGGYLNQEGVVVNSGFERFTGRINLVQKLSTNVTMTANISGSRLKIPDLATGSSDGLMGEIVTPVAFEFCYLIRYY